MIPFRPSVPARPAGSATLRGALASVVVRAVRRWGEPIGAFVVDVGIPLGGALVELVGRLGCGLFHRYAEPREQSAAEHVIVVGAAPLSDLRIIAAGLASADRGLAALGEAAATPGAGGLEASLARARGSKLVLVSARDCRVRRLVVQKARESGFGADAIGHAWEGRTRWVARKVTAAAAEKGSSAGGG